MLASADDLSRLVTLFWGTVIYRPYVYAFFATFLVFALRQLGGRRTLAYIVGAYLIAYASEYSSTRNGFPFGIYTYLDGTRTRELWLSNIPFWDSLSFVFLSYFSWIVASAALGSVEHPRYAGLRTAILSGLLMMLLDIVIDPLTLLGDRWFLGAIYYYPQGGSYFGVTISNFLGWWFVGAITPLAFGRLSQLRAFSRSAWRPLAPLWIWNAFAVYAGVFVFNLAITAFIREWTLFGASLLVAGTTLTWLAFALKNPPSRFVSACEKVA